jgi:hypothetical protein
VVEVELLEGFAGGEAGGADPQLCAGGVAGGDFSVEDGDQVVLMVQPESRAWAASRVAASRIRGAFKAAAR